MIISFVAILPIITLVILALFSRWSFLASAATALGALLIIALTFWEVVPIVIAAASVKGLFITLEITAIIFGALLVFGIFKHLGGENAAKKIFDRIAPDHRVKAVLIAWAFIVFLEGISGFGTPPMITIPILTAIGFSPIISVIISLIGDTLPVTFGAVGLPVTYGFVSTVGAELALQAALLIAWLNLVMAPIVVSFIIFMVSREKNRLLDLWHNIPFIIFASFAVSIPSLIAFKLFGPEMPSVLGGFAGVLLISLYASFRKKREEEGGYELKKYIAPFIPYITVLAALATTRIPAVRDFLGGLMKIDMPSIFGTGISHLIQPLALSAFVFIAVAATFFIYFIIRQQKKAPIEILGESFKKITKPAMALACVIIFVQIMLNSGINNAGLPNMVVAAADIFHGAGRLTTLFTAPFIGALGAFITGSSTVSNLLFSSIQQAAAVASRSPEAIIIAMQGMGSAAGNVIGMHNILAALAVAGIGVKMRGPLPQTNFSRQADRDEAHIEKKVLRANLPFLAIYLAIAGMLGFLVSIAGVINILG